MITSQSSPVFGLSARRLPNRRAFTLIEVTLSIGIIAFAVLTLVALLPVGIATNQNATEQARAMQTANGVAICIKSATSIIASGSGNATIYTYTALAPFNVLKWKVTAVSAAAPTALNFNLFLDENGTSVTPALAKQMVHVTLTPPADWFGTGNAYILVSWDQRVINDPKNLATSALTAAVAPTSMTQLTTQKSYVDTFIYFAP